MSDDPRPIAWSALSKGTPIYSSEGDEVGKVADIVGEVENDIFSGLTLRSGLLDANPQWVPADLVDRLTTDAVRLNVSADEARSLPVYED